MNEVALLPTTHNLNRDFTSLARTCLKYEQADTPVIHRFGPGVYIREALLPAGNIIIGYTHKTAHMNVMLQGRMLVLREDGSVVDLKAPACFTSQPGRKVAYILEDVIWQNVHATEETDVQKLEEVLLEKDEFELPALPVDEVLLLNYAGDAEDYLMAVEEYGFTHQQVLDISNNTTDYIPFPGGAYKAIVADSLRDGKGLFATAEIKVGETIAPMRIDGKRTPAGRFTNHAKQPNAKAVDNGNGTISLVAIKDIAGSSGAYLGEEITVDYRQVLEVNGYRRLTCQPSQ